MQMPDKNLEKLPEKETDLLQYKGNSFPRVLRFAWTVLIIFSVFYLMKYMVPDLKEWLAK